MHCGKPSSVLVVQDVQENLQKTHAFDLFFIIFNHSKTAVPLKAQKQDILFYMKVLGRLKKNTLDFLQKMAHLKKKHERHTMLLDNKGP